MTIFDQRGQRVGIQINVAGDFIMPDRLVFGVPIQYPLPIDHFTNREYELEQLLNKLKPGVTVALCGPGGIGKTALMSRAVQTLAPDNTLPVLFPDGIIFHNFSTYNEVKDVYIHIATSYGEEAGANPRQVVQRILSNKKALLILDGTEQIHDWENEKESLWSLLETVGNCGVLITSQSKADARAIRIDIKPLAIDKSVELLKAWGGKRANDKVSMRQICRLVGGLPLALKIAGRYMEQNEENAFDYLTWLQNDPFIALEQSTDRSLNVRASLKQSIARLSSTAKQSLAIIGQMAYVPFKLQTIAIFLGVPEIGVRRAINELVRFNLLERIDDEDEKYVCHPLVYKYARQNMGQQSTRVSVLHVIRRTINQLDLLPKQALGLFGKMPIAPVEVDVIARSLGASIPAAMQCLDSLVGNNLLSQENNLYECHPLVHQFVKIELEKESPSVNAFSYTNAKGQVYYLHTKEVTLSNGRTQRVYYFARDIRDGSLGYIPAGYEVMETSRTNMPVLKRSKKT